MASYAASLAVTCCLSSTHLSARLRDLVAQVLTAGAQVPKLLPDSGSQCAGGHRARLVRTPRCPRRRRAEVLGTSRGGDFASDGHQKRLGVVVRGDRGQVRAVHVEHQVRLNLHLLLAVGGVAERRLVLRRGARPLGDAVFVIGRAQAGPGVGGVRLGAHGHVRHRLHTLRVRGRERRAHVAVLLGHLRERRERLGVRGVLADERGGWTRRARRRIGARGRVRGEAAAGGDARDRREPRTEARRPCPSWAPRAARRRTRPPRRWG